MSKAEIEAVKAGLSPSEKKLVQILGIEPYIGAKTVTISGVKYTCDPFDTDEIKRWLNDFTTFLAPYKKEIDVDQSGNVKTRLKPMSNIGALLQAKAPHIFVGGQIVRKDTSWGTFEGYMAGADMMGFREIKPTDIMRTDDSTETANTTWEFSFAADDDYWIGYGSNNTTAATIDKYLGMVIVGVANLSDSQVVEQIRFKIGNVEYPPAVLKPALILADTPHRVPVKPVPTMIIKPRDTVLGKAYSSSAATNELVLVGITYGRGQKLTNFAPTSVES